jgi:hypothetical protein
MDLDVVLVPAVQAGLPMAGPVIVVSSAQTMVAAIHDRLGAGNRIGRLRILDSFGAQGAIHPLRASPELLSLRGLFEPAGYVEFFVGPSSTAGPAVAHLGFSGVQGFGGGGFSGGFGGSGRLASPQATPDLSLSQLSFAFGVPVRLGGG